MAWAGLGCWWSGENSTLFLRDDDESSKSMLVCGLARFARVPRGAMLVFLSSQIRCLIGIQKVSREDSIAWWRLDDVKGSKVGR